MTTKNKAAAATVNATTGDNGNATGSNVTAMPQRAKPSNAFAAIQRERSKLAAEKMALLGTVRQQLAEARDLFAAGSSKADEARDVANKAAIGLYQARRDGAVSPDEVTAILGDQFGYKTKKDGSPSKTPKGEGEAIRKRVVRASQANDYVVTGDGGRFFDGLPVDDIKSVCDQIAAGEVSIWTGYEMFAAIKREHSERTDMAFDARRIAALVASLSQDGAGDIVRSNESLLTVYAALIDVLNVIGEGGNVADETVAA